MNRFREITIPGDILDDESLSDGAKILYGKIARLSYKEGYCWANNAFLDGTKSGRNASRLIAELKSAGYINIQTGANQNRKIVLCKIESRAFNPANSSEDQDDRLAKNGEVEDNSLAKNGIPPRQILQSASPKMVSRLAKNGDRTILRTSKRTSKEQNVDSQESTNLNSHGSNEPPDKNNNPSPPLTDSQKQALELSTLLFTAHRKEFPDYLSGKSDKEIKKKIDGWAADIERLIRIDKKIPETIRRVIIWVKTPGNFWFTNIESGAKLRKQFERLYGQMITMPKKQTSPPKRIASDNVPQEKALNYFREAE